MSQGLEDQVARLMEMIGKWSTKKDQLQFVLDQLTFEMEQTNQQRSRLIIENQQLISSSSQIKMKTSSISQQLTQLQPKYQSIFLQNKQLLLKIQRCSNEIKLHQSKRKKSRSLITTQTKRKLTLAADCEQTLQKIEKINQRIQRLKQEKRVMDENELRERATTKEIGKVLKEMRGIEQGRERACF